MAMEPGWYPDPFSSGGYLRWWDGQRWGASTSVSTLPEGPGAPASPPPPPPMPAYAAPAVAPFALAPWGSRAIARIIDSLLEGVLSLPFVMWLVWPAMQRLLAAVPSDGSSPSDAAVSAFQSDVLAASTAITLVSLTVALLYEVPQNKRWGRTLGKRALGIRIRPRDADGPLGWGQVLARWGAFEAMSIVAGGLLLVIDLLWPLWDRPFRQALHDKAARTVVVPAR